MDFKISSARLLSAFECENIEFALFTEIKTNIQVIYKYLIAVKINGRKHPEYFIVSETSPELTAEGRHSLSIYYSEKFSVDFTIDQFEQFDIFIAEAFRLLREKYNLTSKIETINADINEWNLPFCIATSRDYIYEEYDESKLKEIIWEYLSAPFTSLNLSNLSLEYFPREILKLRSLHMLNLSDNKLESIPSEICGLDDLENLDLSKNNITELPEEISGLKNLKLLNLSENPLFELPSTFCALGSLESLEIRDALLNKLPEDFGNLSNLQTLDIRAKFVISLPESLGKLKNLKKLVIENTEITTLPEEIGDLINLEELHIIENSNLKNLPDSLGNLTNLKYLYVYGNSIKTLPESVNQLPNIKKVYFK